MTVSGPLGDIEALLGPEEKSAVQALAHGGLLDPANMSVEVIRTDENGQQIGPAERITTGSVQMSESECFEAALTDALGRVLPVDLNKALLDLECVARGSKRGFRIFHPLTDEHITTSFAGSDWSDNAVNQHLGNAKIIAIRAFNLPKDTVLAHVHIEPGEARDLLDRLK